MGERKNYKVIAVYEAPQLWEVKMWVEQSNPYQKVGETVVSGSLTELFPFAYDIFEPDGTITVEVELMAENEEQVREVFEGPWAPLYVIYLEIATQDSSQIGKLRAHGHTDLKFREIKEIIEM